MNMPPIEFVGGLHIPTLEGFHDHLLNMAAEVIATGKELPTPMAYVLSDEGSLAVVPLMSLDKTAVALYQKLVVKQPMTRACALVFESWVTSHPKGTDPKKVSQPSDDPNRGEAVIVSIMTKGRQAFSINHIERPSNIVRKEPFKWLDEAGGTYEGRFIRNDNEPLHP
jgi:hypothetical protein